MKQKHLIILFLSVLFASCNQPSQINDTKEIEVSFNFHSCNEVIYLAYTEDSDSLWENREWLEKIKNQMSSKYGFKAVVVFDSKDHVPIVLKDSITFSKEYDKYVVCKLWIVNYDSTNFCYGEINQKGDFEYCE